MKTLFAFLLLMMAFSYAFVFVGEVEAKGPNLCPYSGSQKCPPPLVP